MISQTMFGCWNIRGYWSNVYDSEFKVRMCGNKKNIVKLLVVEDVNGDYYGWLSNGVVSLIWPNLICLEMCFPGGLVVAESSGKGKRIRLSIKVDND